MFILSIFWQTEPEDELFLNTNTTNENDESCEGMEW